MVENIIIKTPRGYYLSDDSILVYDNIQGGLGLVQHLYDELPLYARKLVLPDNDGENEDRQGAARVNQASARSFLQWLDKGPGTSEAPIPKPDETNWWGIVTNGSEVRVYSQERGEMATGTVMNRYWDDGIGYHVSIGQEWVNVADDNINQATPNFDYEIWNPRLDRTREFYVEEDGY